MDFAKGGLINLPPGKMYHSNQFIGYVSPPKRKSKGWRKHVREAKAQCRAQHRHPIKITIKPDFSINTFETFLLPYFPAMAKTVIAIGGIIRDATERFRAAQSADATSYEAAIKRIMSAKRGPIIEQTREGNPLPAIGQPPCGECHLKPGETCDICGARAAGDDPPPAAAGSNSDRVGVAAAAARSSELDQDR